MKQDLQYTMALLERTPAAMDALLRGLPAAWTETNEGGNTWSVRGVVAHLIHCEREDWMPRMRVILQPGELKTFPPFDREGGLPSSGGKTMGQLLDEFAALRAANLAEVRALKLTPVELERRGQHPALGEVTLNQLLATWAAHDLTHMHQVARVMAHQYREAVGPWVKFLGVMQCAGHSE